MQHALYRSMQYGMRCKQQRDKTSTITKRNKYKPSASAHTHYLSEKVPPCIHVNCWLSGLDFHSFMQFATCSITLTLPESSPWTLPVPLPNFDAFFDSAVPKVSKSPSLHQHNAQRHESPSLSNDLHYCYKCCYVIRITQYCIHTENNEKVVFGSQHNDSLSILNHDTAESMWRFGC